MTKKELLEKIKKQNKICENRWNILKEYLGVKEEEYAELETRYYPFFDIEETKPVKKTRLVKINKSKK